MKRLSLKAGHCITESGSRCTFERSQCGVDDTVVSPWRSAGEMRGAPYTAHGGYCLLAKSVREMTLGRCSGVDQCVPNAASCKFAANFNEAYDCVMEEVTFGSCGERCSWSPADCLAGEEWTFPAAGCSYDKVRVGGCDEWDMSVYCAVSVDGCGAGSTYLTPLEIVAKMDTECYVGMAATVPVEDSVAQLNEALAETGTGFASGGTETGTGSASGGLGVPAIVGAAVGGALVAALVGYVTVVLHRKKKASAKKEERVFQSTDFENPPPKE